MAASTTTSGYEDAVNAQVEELVQHSLNQFFLRVGQNKPEKIDVSTSTEFDMSKREPAIRKLALEVTLTSDLPAEVIREARQDLLHTLQGNGYRTQTAKTAKDEAKPLATLVIDVLPVEHPEGENSLREFMIFGALISAALAAAFVAGNMLSRGLRGKKPPSKAVKQQDPSAAGRRSTAYYGSVKSEPAHYWPDVAGPRTGLEHDWPDAGAQVDLPPLPRTTTSQPTSATKLPPLRLDQVQRDT